MSDILNRQQPLAGDREQADEPFLRRILFGLIAATLLSGTFTLALAGQHELVERFQIASSHGPA